MKLNYDLKPGMKVEIGDGDITVFNKIGKTVYYENEDGWHSKTEYDSNYNEVYYENSNGNWFKKEYDENNNEVYYENSKGKWSKKEYDDSGNEIYYENSNGSIIDNRRKPKLTKEQYNFVTSFKGANRVEVKSGKFNELLIRRKVGYVPLVISFWLKDIDVNFDNLEEDKVYHIKDCAVEGE